MSVRTGWQRLKAAFLAPANLWALTVTGGAAAATGEPLALWIAAGAEAVYLGILSQLGRKEELRRGEAPSAEVVSLLEELAPSQREHYFHLKDLRDRILAQYARLPGGRVLVASTEARVDQLLTSFLRLIATLNAYRTYLSAADRAVLDRELRELEADVASERNDRLREVKERRTEILRLRLDRFDQAKESREVVSHQLAGIEDLLRLTHEQSIALRDPAAAARQLELLTAEVESTQETVREMERFLEFSEEVAPVPSHGVRVRS